MIEVRRYNGLAVSRPHVARDHQGVHAWLLSFLQAVGEKVGGATLWLAGICPLYVFHNVLPQRRCQPLDPVSCLALIGLGFAASLAALCAPYK